MNKMPAAPRNLHEFVVLEHPLLPQRILSASSFSWPAFILGPFWLIFKRLWSKAALAVLCIVGFKVFLAISGLFKTDLVDCGYIGDKFDCSIEVSPWLFFIFQLAINAVCGVFGNQWWGGSLLSRGYLITNIFKAASPDHVRAILVRQNVQTDRQGTSHK